jgi:hypothetical protein
MKQFLEMIERLMNKLTFAQFLVLFVMTVCFGYFFWVSKWAFVLNKDMPTDVSEIKMAIISAFSLAGGYIFGSSNSSNKKNELINNMMKNDNKGNSPLPEPTPPPANIER